ncbi:hypothetical protein KY49_5030 [Burkholderia sp. MSHR3999]|nr:hypothetical protein KY49_5030 [Burkholderia sp. MSHR3999]
MKGHRLGPRGATPNRERPGTGRAAAPNDTRRS